MIGRFSKFKTLHNILDENMTHWLKRLLIASLFILSILIPHFVSISSAFRVILFLIGFAMLLVIIYWPQLGLIALIPASLFVPIEITTGTNTSINITIILLTLLSGLWLLSLIINRNDLSHVKSRTILPLLFLVVFSILAFIVGQLPWFSFVQQAPLAAQLGGLAIFILSAAAFLLVVYQVNNYYLLQWLTWTFLVLGSFATIGLLLNPILGDLMYRYYQRGAMGSMFWTWLVALAFGQAVINQRLHLFWRMLLGGLVVATLFVAYFRLGNWKSGYLPAVVAMVTIIVIRYRRARLLLIFVGALPMANLLAQGIADDQYSFETRLDAFRLMPEIIKVNPVLGLGPANYRFYTPLLRIRGYFVEFNSHNQYLDIVAQIGLLGLFAFSWFAFEVGRAGLQLRNKAPEGFARAYVYGALGGLMGTLAAGMLVDWFLPFVYNIGLNGFKASVFAWIFLGGLVAVEQIINHQE